MLALLQLGGLNGMEWIIIALVVFLLFGASRLPQLAKSLGQSRKAFKEGLKEGEEEYQSEQQKKQMSSNVDAPQISAMSDEDLLAEMQRRVGQKQS